MRLSPWAKRGCVLLGIVVGVLLSFVLVSHVVASRQEQYAPVGGIDEPRVLLKSSRHAVFSFPDNYTVDIVDPGHGGFTGFNFWRFVEQNKWEPSTFRVLRHYCTAEGSYLDFGAWNGVTALYAAPFAKHVYALEPDPVAWEEVATNVALNPQYHSRITLYPLCISDARSTRTIYGSGGMSDSHIYRNEDMKRKTNALNAIGEVQCYTLPEFVRLAGLTNLSLIKIDTEGAEVSLLPVAFDYLRQERPSLWLSFHMPFWPDNIDRDATFNQLFGTLASIYKYTWGMKTTGNAALNCRAGKGFCTILFTDKDPANMAEWP